MKCKAAQKGIALIQVLLLTAILSVLVLYITHTARQKVVIATYADEKVQAYVQLENLKNRILFHLLTSDMQSAMEYKPMGSSQIINHWNLYGEPFKITDKVTVSDGST